MRKFNIVRAETAPRKARNRASVNFPPRLRNTAFCFSTRWTTNCLNETTSTRDTTQSGSSLNPRLPTASDCRFKPHVVDRVWRFPSVHIIQYQKSTLGVEGGGGLPLLEKRSSSTTTPKRIPITISTRVPAGDTTVQTNRKCLPVSSWTSAMLRCNSSNSGGTNQSAILITDKRVIEKQQRLQNRQQLPLLDRLLLPSVLESSPRRNKRNHHSASRLPQNRCRGRHLPALFLCAWDSLYFCAWGSPSL